jgi:hypothetical protein
MGSLVEMQSQRTNFQCFQKQYLKSCNEATYSLPYYVILWLHYKKKLRTLTRIAPKLLSQEKYKGERELSSLQYLGDYVMQNIYKKH